MSSRKKKKNKTPLPAPVPMRPVPAPGHRRTVVFVVVLLASLLVGGAIGAGVFLLNRKPIDLGPVNVPGAATATAAADDSTVYAAYAGSASCRACHPQAYEAWSTSHHGLAERDVVPALDDAAFNPPRTFNHGTQSTQVRGSAGTYEVVTPGYDATAAAYRVARVIGVDPLRQFLTPVPGGRMQTLEASYDPRRNEWFDVYGAEDRRFGEWGHWTGRGMNWNSQCAACHNTRVRKNYDERADAYQTHMAEMTVSCESCHGPMKQHATAHREHPATAPHPLAPSSPHPATSGAYRFTKDQIRDTCGSCHARRAEVTGDFVPGDAFADHFSLSIPDISDLFYPDGQVREEDYEFTAFLGSKMHAAGVRCLDCHDPHTSKTILAGNNLCMRCHNGSFKGSPVIVPELHSFHKVDSTGNQCVNCHMPQTTYMQRHGRHDHGFTTPDPLLTKEQDIPNACNRCHADKDADWAITATDKWYGEKMRRPTRERARAIARARKGEEAAREPLTRELAEGKHAFWQAVSAAVLERWVAAPDVRAALVMATGHADPLVRENAARSLMAPAMQGDGASRPALMKLLDDPVRAVRVRAAWALRETVDPASRAGRDVVAQLHQNADQPTGALQQGSYAAARGDLDAALACYTRAVTWDPNAAPARDALANLMILRGDTVHAAEQYDWAAKLAPHDPTYPYKLALTYVKLNDVAKAKEAAERALKADPTFGPATEVLRSLGQPQ